jgi:hypothetical protein
VNLPKKCGYWSAVNKEWSWATRLLQTNHFLRRNKLPHPKPEIVLPCRLFTAQRKPQANAFLPASTLACPPRIFQFDPDADWLPGVFANNHATVIKILYPRYDVIGFSSITEFETVP